MKIIIGIAGVKTSGKDTVANIIKKFIPEANSVALADKLKNICAATFNLSRELFDDQRYKEVPFRVFGISKILTMDSIIKILEDFDISPAKHLQELYYHNLIGLELKSARHIAQVVGTEILRQFGSSYIHCQSLPLDSDVTIITDIRFPNEFEYFNKLAEINSNAVIFIPLYVSRSSAEVLVNSMSHSSETSIFIFRDKCIKVDNNSNLDNLERNIKNILLNASEKFDLRSIKLEILKNSNL